MQLILNIFMDTCQAVIAIHQAYIDSVIDLPTSSIDNNGNAFNVQSIVNNVGGAYGIEGDAGNYIFTDKWCY